jgi:hypothetical protein
MKHAVIIPWLWNYNYMLHNKAEKRVSHLNHGGSLRSCTVLQKLLQGSTKFPEDEGRKLLQNACN